MFRSFSRGFIRHMNKNLQHKIICMLNMLICELRNFTVLFSVFVSLSGECFLVHARSWNISVKLLVSVKPCLWLKYLMYLWANMVILEYHLFNAWFMFTFFNSNTKYDDCLSVFIPHIFLGQPSSVRFYGAVKCVWILYSYTYVVLRVGSVRLVLKQCMACRPVVGATQPSV